MAFVPTARGRHPEMYEQLGRWDEALAIHEADRKEHPGQVEPMKGIMRCLAEIGRWGRALAVEAKRGGVGGDLLWIVQLERRSVAG